MPLIWKSTKSQPSSSALVELQVASPVHARQSLNRLASTNAGVAATVGQFPLTATKKKDRAALPSSLSMNELRHAHCGRGSRRSDSAANAPRTVTERALMEIWTTVLLGHEAASSSSASPTLSVHDNFFQLGGDSLTALRVLRAIARSIEDQVGGCMYDLTAPWWCCSNVVLASENIACCCSERAEEPYRGDYWCPQPCILPGRRYLTLMAMTVTAPVHQLGLPVNCVQRCPTIALFAQHLDDHRVRLRGAEGVDGGGGLPVVPQSKFEPSAEDLLLRKLSAQEKCVAVHYFGSDSGDSFCLSESGRKQLVCTLLTQKVDPNGGVTRRNPGTAPLHAAARNGSLVHRLQVWTPQAHALTC